MTTPVQAYTVVDEGKPNEDAGTMTSQITQAIDAAVKKESKGKMKNFDAVIVYGEFKNMEYIKFNNGLGAVNENGAAYPYIYNTKKQDRSMFILLQYLINHMMCLIHLRKVRWGKLVLVLLTMPETRIKFE